jgi:signal transduction histidine kinase
LNSFRDGKFTHFKAKDGLLSNNISSIVEDEESLWLGTTRGICRIPKQQLRDFAEQKLARLYPTNYGVEDGLRSAQAAPGYPVARGGTRTSDGRVWFPTGRGLAVIDPHAPQPSAPAPTVHLIEATVDGNTTDLSQALRLRSSVQRLQFRFTGIHLSAPERVQYSHKLEGLDADWVQAGNRREISYNNLTHGKYRLLVRAELPGRPAVEQAYEFEKLPKFYETWWVRLLFVTGLIAAAWGAYQLRVRRLRYGFAMVLEERARLAREIHDTLAQGFVGISSQLAAVDAALPEEQSAARKCLDVARRMARHSMTEARHSIMDLRASVSEGQNIAVALQSRAQMWTAGSGVQVEVDVPDSNCTLPDNFERELMRIGQEAVTNAVKHAGANRIWIKLCVQDHKQIYLEIVDDGQGFDQEIAFCQVGAHFGLIGMRERAERLGGHFQLATRPGKGTRIEVTVPF